MAHPLSRTDVRLGVTAALGAAVLIGGAAFMAGGSETVRPLGPGLDIALVAPVEPVIDPGETMEVGALSDGFDRAMLDRAAQSPVDEFWMPEPAWIGDDVWGDEVPRMPMPTPVGETRVIESRPPASDPLADGSRAFGFDRPTPDYAQERRVRWVRLEQAGQSPVASPENATVETVQYSPE